MTVMRLVVAGTVAAGKSTFVQTASEIGVVSTERIATDATADLKKTTTVAFDFSRVTLSSQQILHIYGTPGQYRFNFMWDILIQKAHACLLLVAAHRPEDIEPTRQILSFMRSRSQSPITIGLTHLDCLGSLSPDSMVKAWGYIDRTHPLPVVALDPHDRTSVFKTLETVAAGLTTTA